MSETEHEVILAQVRAIIADLVDVEPGAIHMGADLREDLRADSLDRVEIVMALEEAFGIELKEEQAADLRTVGDLVRGIASLREAANAGAA